MWDVQTDQIFKASDENAIVLKVKPSYLRRAGCLNSNSACWVSAIACDWMGSRSYIIERKKLIPIPASELPLYMNLPYIEPIFYKLLKEAS